MSAARFLERGAQREAGGWCCGGCRCDSFLMGADPSGAAGHSEGSRRVRALQAAQAGLRSKEQVR